MMNTNVKVDIYMGTTKIDKETKRLVRSLDINRQLIQNNKNFTESLLKNKENNKKINLLEDINLLGRNEELITNQIHLEDNVIKLPTTRISKGNFYYPLKRNYKVLISFNKNEVKSGELKYFVKHTKKTNSDEVLSHENNYINSLNWTFEDLVLPDDSKTNSLIIQLFQTYMKDKSIFNHDEYYEFFKTIFTKILRKDSLERMKKLYFRFKVVLGDFTNL